MEMYCTDGLGFKQTHQAEGWLCDPKGKRIMAMCQAHADLVIEEYETRLYQTWTFTPAE